MRRLPCPQEYGQGTDPQPYVHSVVEISALEEKIVIERHKQQGLRCQSSQSAPVMPSEKKPQTQDDQKTPDKPVLEKAFGDFPGKFFGCLQARLFCFSHL